MAQLQKAGLELVDDETVQDDLHTKLTKFVRIAEEVSPAAVEAPSIQQFTELAGTLVAELTNHLRAQDQRIAELEALATTDELTKIFNRRGFES